MVDASHCSFDYDSLVNLPFSLTHIEKYFEHERFEDLLVKEDGFHIYNDPHLSYDNNDVGMYSWKLVE